MLAARRYLPALTSMIGGAAGACGGRRRAWTGRGRLLFWLSLIPVLTEWIGEHYGDTTPAVTYGVVCLGAAMAFTILTEAIIRADGRGSSPVAAAIGRDVKGRVSLAVYAAAIGLAFVSPYISYALIACVSVMWFVPDRRLSR
jgi:uncharacterized membrane protein